MKTIRSKVFETNSSSTHSFTMYNGNVNEELTSEEFIAKFLDNDNFRRYINSRKFNDKTVMTVADWLEVFMSSNEVEIEVEYDG